VDRCVEAAVEIAQRKRGGRAGLKDKYTSALAKQNTKAEELTKRSYRALAPRR
jgi:hypothetical protein